MVALVCAGVTFLPANPGVSAAVPPDLPRSLNEGSLVCQTPNLPPRLAQLPAAVTPVGTRADVFLWRELEKKPTV